VKIGVSRIAAFVIALLGLVSSRAFGQEKNEVGLVIGATVTQGRSFATGNTSSASFNASLALAAEYDRRFFGGERVALSAGADFLASPLDVKISNPPPDLIGQYDVHLSYTTRPIEIQWPRIGFALGALGWGVCAVS
jgi:hypothetical protein